MSPPSFAGYSALWLDSGTAALALAIAAARQARPDVTHPEVVLPGYACPDLVAAAEFAGVVPVLADIGADDPGYDLESLGSMLGERTVAVVAVNFLGIADRLDAIRGLCASASASADSGARPIALIEDDAQWFPESDQPLVGDLVCVSFGRGKPVSLLGGGGLLTRSGYGVPVEQILSDVGSDQPVGAGVGWRLKTALFNRLLQRRLYALATRNPWVSVGDTVFEPLTAIRPLGDRAAYIGSNAAAWLSASRAREALMSKAVSHMPGIVDLPAVCGQRARRLLRYPVLCHSAQARTDLLAISQREGLGMTAMYRQVLPEIDGVASRLGAAAPLTGAKRFAERLLTLPIHEGVTGRDIERMRHCLLQASAQRARSRQV